jgi:alkyl sulfatase BDS1-like metallo-beta-lactamase superfamily hydrolase
MLVAVATGVACGGTPLEVEQARPLPSPEALEAHCAEVVGEPRVEQVAEDIWVAVGYDLANTILIGTPDGNVVVDPGMSPARAIPIRDALLALSPGPIRAVVYTHSHIDHVGGASVWVEEGTEVWATDAFTGHFFKQYGLFFPAESARGGRQFGRHVPLEQLACSGLGRRPDLEAVLDNGTVLPDRTFRDTASLEVGGLTLELVEAHGETHDQLFVWIPEREVLLPGDNWYLTFPNLYTIRGSTPRPVDAWIESLDAMRRKDPAVLVPSHTPPVTGREAVRTALRDYRDGIQWVRDAVVRGANAGTDLDALAAEVGLPPHLRDDRALMELYGQIDWSVRGIYTGQLGWFDGRADQLYPLPPKDRATRTVALMGGAERVLVEARRAREAGDARWALHLLALLEDAGSDQDLEVAQTLEDLAVTVHNPNGRAYLLESAWERRHGFEPLREPTYQDAFLAALPLDLVFSVMPAKLRPGEALDVHETVVFRFQDVEETYVVTVRHGLAEVVRGAPLPGTPEPVATVHTDAGTWRRLALDLEKPLGAITSGRIRVEGDLLAFRRFMGRFER